MTFSGLSQSPAAASGDPAPRPQGSERDPNLQSAASDGDVGAGGQLSSSASMYHAHPLQAGSPGASPWWVWEWDDGPGHQAAPGGSAGAAAPRGNRGLGTSRGCLPAQVPTNPGRTCPRPITIQGSSGQLKEKVANKDTELLWVEKGGYSLKAPTWPSSPRSMRPWAQRPRPSSPALTRRGALPSLLGAQDPRTLPGAVSSLQKS